jgi:hypothetical protein
VRTFASIAACRRFLPTIAAARDDAAFGFTCHKMHVSLKELRSSDSELAGDD